MNKFEQVSSLGHQMSLALGLGPYTGEGAVSCTEGGGRPDQGALYSEVQCIMDRF